MKRFAKLNSDAATLVLVLAISFGAAGSLKAQQPKKGGTLVHASVSGPGTLDPYMRQAPSNSKSSIIFSRVW